MRKQSQVYRTCVRCSEFKQHNARGLCNACYSRCARALTLHKFPRMRAKYSAAKRYDDWVASGLTCKEYARSVGIWETSLSRALRAERQRRDRLGLPWLTGWRRVINP